MSPTWCVAVGNETRGSVSRPFVELLTADTWFVQPKWSGVNAGSSLAAVSCSSTHSCMAVGTYLGASGSAPLSEHWNGSVWNIDSPSHGRGHGPKCLHLRPVRQRK